MGIEATRKGNVESHLNFVHILPWTSAICCVVGLVPMLF